MNVTFLIGNGFDLGLGLNTSFEDFYPEYLKSKSANKNILEFKENIAKDIKNWSDFEYQLGQYTSDFKEDDWEKFLDLKEDFEEKFFDYLKKEQNRIRYKINENKIINKFKYALKNLFSEEFLPRAISNKFYFNVVFGDVSYSFVNFNYTNTLDKILEILKKDDEFKPQKNEKSYFFPIYRYEHAHGRLSDFSIIGVNNIEQIANENFRNVSEFCNSMIKEEMNKTIKMGYLENSETIINETDILCVYGTSLGITDIRWWKKIISWLTEKKFLIFFMYEKDFKKNNIRQLTKQNKKMIKLLCSRIGKEESFFNEIEDRIVFLFNKNIFEIDLTKDESDNLSHSNILKAIENRNKNIG